MSDDPDVEIPKLLRGIVCGTCLGAGVKLEELADVVRRAPCPDCDGQGFGIVAGGALRAEINRRLEARDQLELRVSRR